MNSFTAINCILLGMMISSDCKLQCLDDNNLPVDWYVGYKLPQLDTSSNPLLQKGVGVAYITSEQLEKGWIMSTKPVSAPDSILGLTLKPLYEAAKAEDMLWLLYNDETPNHTVTFELGHTKGVVLGRADGGVWLVHSIPKFPPEPTSGYDYPISGTIYGQSFLCLTLDEHQLDLIGLQLQYNEPQVYSHNLPPSLEKKLPLIADVIRHTPIVAAPWYHQQQISTSGGIQFLSFAKSRKFGKDLYADWVAQVLKANLLVETWPNGHGRLPSNCMHPYKVKNVADIDLKVADAKFSTHSDHCKWAVSDNSTFWLCVGDINRMESQKHRGGGTICLNNAKLAAQYRNAVVEVEPCSKNRRISSPFLNS